MDARELRFAVEELQYAYVHCIDADRLEQWPDFFTDPCRYEVTTRENLDQGLSVGVIYCDSKGMLRDRVVALREANIYGPHRYRHMISAVRVTGTEGNVVQAETNYAVYRTMLDPINHRRAAATGFQYSLYIGKYSMTFFFYVIFNDVSFFIQF